MRYTGMRISDTAMLQASALNGNRVFLYTHKTGIPVQVPVPDFVANELTSVCPVAGYIFLRGESTRRPECAQAFLAIERGTVQSKDRKSRFLGRNSHERLLCFKLQESPNVSRVQQIAKQFLGALVLCEGSICCSSVQPSFLNDWPELLDQKFNYVAS
jgi:hypothetical protein